MSVTLLLQIASSFLFLDEIEPFFARQFCTWHSTKLFFFDFWFRLPNAQNVLTKICTCTKSPITRFVWPIDQRCLRLLGAFRGWPIQWNHLQCCGLTLVAMATKFKLLFDKITYKSACMPDSRDMFWPTRGDDQETDLCCHGNDHICARRGV